MLHRRPSSAAFRATTTLLSGAATIAAILPAALTGSAAAQVDPNQGMLRSPDISGESIVFVYANDLWVVDKDGGTARPLASPPGQESTPRFSPDGETIAFIGNYDGGRDIYTIDADGGLPTRVTHHPGGERLCDWHGDDALLFASMNMNGLGRQPKLFSVGHAGGLPDELPVPYGQAGAVSQDGEWLAYTPNNRDTRTWKRYRGGMASDVWLFNLKTMESRRVTDWEGTDTQPMWSPDGRKVLYYLSDRGDEHRLNIWRYDVGRDRHEQMTDFADYDVKWPAIGPKDDGDRNDRGEIIFQHASQLKILDLRTSDIREVDVTIPGARPTLRPQREDVSELIADWGIAPDGVRAVAEARGDIWTLPKENGSPRNLTRTSGVAERDPSWSPDGRWIVYFSDATGEYELYVTQSDGKGETRQLTEGSETYYYGHSWSPDSTKFAFSDKASNFYIHDFETGETTLFDREPRGGQPSMNWSHDSRWLTYARSTEQHPTSSVFIYDTESGDAHQVTHGMFSDSSPVFDHKGEWLYFASDRNFSPTYSSIDLSFIYNNSGVLVAVPLHDDVEWPWSLESDEVSWKDEDESSDDDDDDDDDGDGDGDDHDGDHDADDDHDSDDDGDAADDADDDDAKPARERRGGGDADDAATALAGSWSGTLKGLSAAGAPPEMDTVPFNMTIKVADDGTISGSSEAMGESSDFDSISFDAEDGTFEATTKEDGVTSVLRGTLDDGTMSGEWELVEVGVSGTWEATRSDDRWAGVEFSVAGVSRPVPAAVTTRLDDSYPDGPFAGVQIAAGRERMRAHTQSVASGFIAEITGTWEGSLNGLSAMGLPPEMDSAPFSMDVRRSGGGYSASMIVMGEEQAFDEASFDESSGRFEARSSEDGMTSILIGTVSGTEIDGTWEVVEAGAKGTWSGRRSGGGASANASASSGDDAGEESDADESSDGVQIDLEGFEARAVQIPVGPGTYFNLAVNHKNQLIYVRAGGPNSGIKLFDMADDSRSEKTVQAGVGGFIMDGVGKTLIYPTGRGGMIRPATAGGSSKPVVTRGMVSHVEPRAEWAQLLRDAWRIQRDFFYVANMHGVDWDAVYDQYAAMLADAVTREDVSYIIREMISELNVGHAYYWGGDEESAPNRNVGLLGVDFEMHDGAYRIAEIVHGGPWDLDARNPLHLQGTGIKEGHYLHAVNGVRVDTDLDPWAAFLETAGREITVTVSESSEMDDSAMDVVVRPIGGDGNLRYRAWIESKRKMVDEMSDGQVGYIYVPNTGIDGQNDLFRQFYGQIGKKALIIDERWNGGGQIPTRFIELLNRPVTNFWGVRDSIDWKWPPDSHQGPKCMLINGLAGSGGDMFPWLFKEAGLGKLIGTRTWGGLVGISGNPTLIDGGYTAVPTFGFYETDGTWGIEGHGVDPDIEVIDDPAKMVDGGDPQLERAIEEMLKEIKTFDYPTRNRPEAPDRSGMGIAEEDK